MIGHVIKRERINKNIKQNYLAKGVCSPSYLSKIENNEIQPSRDILTILARKLEINLDLISNNEITEGPLLNNLYHVYKEVSLKREQEFIKEKVNYFSANRFSYLTENLFYPYNLLMIRLTLANNIPLDDFLLFLQPLLDKTHLLSRYHLYLLRKFEGIYYYKINDISMSQKKFDEAEQLINLIVVEDWERADFYYMFSLVSLAGNKPYQALLYCENSYHFFLENLYFERLVECYILRAISYKKTKNFKASIKSYERARKVIEKFLIEDYDSTIFQNLGSLYAYTGEYEEAINYYIKSLELKTNLNERLITILSIIKVNSKIIKNSEVLYWVNRGLLEIGEKEEYLNFRNHFMFYRDIIQINYIENPISLFKVINYFEEKQDYRHIYKYCIRLGDVLNEKKRYKEAAIYYKKSLMASIKNSEFDSWEDI